MDDKYPEKENGGEILPLCLSLAFSLTSLQRLEANCSFALGISSKKVASLDSCEWCLVSLWDSVLAFSLRKETSRMVHKLGFSFIGLLGKTSMGPSNMV